MISVWEVEPGPWSTFKDALWLDEHDRRTEGLRAVLRWSKADALMLVDARFELQKLEDRMWEWERDIDERRVAHHKAHPGDEWDRRAPLKGEPT